MGEPLAGTLQVDDGPIFCRACRLDVTDEPEQRGVRTCPRCGRGVRRDGSNSAPRPRAECRCLQCGFDVGGLPGTGATVRCPECGGDMNILNGPFLEPWPGEAAALKTMISYWPMGLGAYLALLGVFAALNTGPPGPVTVWGSLLFCMILSVGEAAARARGIVRASVPVRERPATALRLAGIGVGLSLACWIPVIAFTVLALYVF